MTNVDGERRTYAERWNDIGEWNPDRYIIRAEIGDRKLYFIDDYVGWSAQRSMAMQFAEEISALMTTQQLAESSDDGVQFDLITCEKLDEEEKNKFLFFEKQYGVPVNHYFYAIERAKERLEKRKRRTEERVERQAERDKKTIYKNTPRGWWS